MGQAADDFKILLNVLGRTGLEGDIISEFSKAKSMVHRYDSQALVAKDAESMQNQGNLAPITEQPMPSTTEGQIMPTDAQNQGGMPQDQGMGQGQLNLPPM